MTFTEISIKRRLTVAVIGAIPLGLSASAVAGVPIPPPMGITDQLRRKNGWHLCSAVLRKRVYLPHDVWIGDQEKHGRLTFLNERPEKVAARDAPAFLELDEVKLLATRSPSSVKKLKKSIYREIVATSLTSVQEAYDRQTGTRLLYVLGRPVEKINGRALPAAPEIYGFPGFLEEDGFGERLEEAQRILRYAESIGYTII